MSAAKPPAAAANIEEAVTPGRGTRARRIVKNVSATIELAWAASPRTLMVVAVSTVVTAMVGPASLLLTGRFIDGIAQHPSSVKDARLLWPLIGLAAIALITRSLNVVVDRAQSIFSERVHMTARFRFLRHLANSDIALLESARWRDRLQRARGDVSWRPHSMVQTLVGMFASSITLLTVFSALLALDPLLLLVGVLSVFPPIAVRFRVNDRLYKLYWTTTRREREHDYLVNVAGDTQYAKDVRAYALGDTLVDRAQALSEHRHTQLRGIYRSANAFDFAGGLLSAVLLLGAYALISERALLGKLSIGDVAVVLGAFASVTAQLGSLLSSLVGVDQHAQFLDDYFSFLATTPAVRAPSQGTTLTEPVHTVTLNDVGFCYPDDGAGDVVHHALAGVTLEVRRGQTLALVGENGAGKSTLVKLLLRFFDPTSGHIAFNGVDIATLEPLALRECVGVLFQDYASYELEVREGLRFGRVHAAFDEQRALRAIQAAQANDVIADIGGGARGLDSVVGRVLEGGHDLSGGQWQRLALARLLYRDADVWILDEPTANLDPAAEARFFEELRVLAQHRIVIVISHRFCTVRSADQIAVLNDGRVCEHGTHDRLMALGGRYAHLFTLQAQSYR